MLTYPGNKTVSYGYDVLNRLKTVKIDWLTGTPTTTYHYDAAGRMYQADQANGTTTSYNHDNANRLKGVTHTKNNQSQTLADYQYTLDANGNRIKAMVDAPILPAQLINRSQNHSYNPQKNRLISTSQASFSYDDEGQIKTKTETSTSNATNFSFDYAHRLTSQSNNQYTYDGVGNRIKAIRNGSTTKYIYDAAGNLLAEANSANQITRYYIYGHGMLGFIETASNQLYIYHHDGTGHTVAITDQSQSIINTYAYDPYGNIMGESETIAQPFKYVGQLGVQAEDNGLYYMRARYYDAEIGRFISEDPIGFAGGINLYAYVGGNPVMLVDPSGLEATSTPSFNPTKLSVGTFNGLNATRLSFESRVLALVSVFSFGLGQPEIGIPAAGLSLYKANSAISASVRGGQQIGEAFAESFGDATPRNLLGVLPFGQQYDDPGEPLPHQIDLFRGKSAWDIASEIGTVLP